jgi:uncharacterized protein
MNIAFPYAIDRSGRTASTDTATHVSDMIEQILLTAPGERVNRPTFGSGTAQLVFAPNSDTLAIAQQQIIQAGLQQWLSDLIQVRSVQVSNVDSRLTIIVQYVLIATQQQQTAQVTYQGGGP